jgi:hypothetical protein
MESKKNRLSVSFRFVWVATLFITLAFLSGCSSKKTVSFKINSVPKGAHVLYQVVGKNIPCQGQWIYLGNTPVQGVRQFNEGQLKDADKITLKIMHRGYHNQSKEWDGVGFWKEVEQREGIFWAPELTLSPKEQ